MQFVHNKWIVAFVIGVLVFAPGQAYSADSVSARDTSVDAILLGGPLPATGSQPVAGGVLPATGTVPGSGLINPAAAGGGELPGLAGLDLRDHQARVYEVQGSAKITGNGIEGWKKLRKNTVIQKGHKILTGKNGKVSLTYDENYWNVSYIPSNTKAEFRSIEPTDIFLEDGTIYNILDGLPAGDSYKISTPTAVTAVRGTWYVVHFTLSTGESISATIDIPDDGHSSFVEVFEYLSQGQGPSVQVPEGNEIHLSQGTAPDPSLLQTIDPKWLTQLEEFLKHLAELREEFGDNFLPPTGSEFFEGLGGGSDNGPELDPLDTGSTNPNPTTPQGGDSFSPSGEGGDLEIPDEDPDGPDDPDWERYFSKR